MPLRRLVLTVLAAVMAACAAHAETLESNGMGCRERADFEAIKTATSKIGNLVSTGACRLLRTGQLVNIQERDGGLIKVGIIGVNKDVEVFWTGDAALKPVITTGTVGQASKGPPQWVGVATLAAALAMALMLWFFKRSDSRPQIAPAVAGNVEIWEEQRLPRSIFGQLVVLVFVLFNGWMLLELLNFFAKVEGVRGQFRDNGFAQLGINLMANTRLNEIFVLWAIGAGVLGLAVLGTRGRKQLVRRTG